jgi:transposase-like protein
VGFFGEVAMGAGRGPARSVERERFWRRIVARQPGTGVSIREWCERHDVSVPSFYAWRRELARRDAEQLDDQSVIDSDPAPAFVELEVAGTSPSLFAAAAIQIVVEDLRVAVGPGFDAETLRRILDVLRRSSGRGASTC